MAKPVPTDDILTDAQADARYNAAIETWGDTISAAAGRMCRQFVRMGATLPFPCPPPLPGDNEQDDR